MDFNFVLSFKLFFFLVVSFLLLRSAGGDDGGGDHEADADGYGYRWGSFKRCLTRCFAFCELLSVSFFLIFIF